LRTASLILAIMLAAGCRSTPKPAGATTKPTIITTLTRSGGLVGGSVESKVWSDGVWEATVDRGTTPRRVGAMTPEALRRLTVALGATILAEENYPASKGAADAFQYTLRAEGRLIRWSEASPDVPEPLRRVAEIFSGEILSRAATSQGAPAIVEDR
jgi:hypothetical protein